MIVKIEERGGKRVLVFEAELGAREVSKSGKSELVFSTHGTVKSGVVVDGREMSLSVNAYIGRG